MEVSVYSCSLWGSCVSLTCCRILPGTWGNWRGNASPWVSRTGQKPGAIGRARDRHSGAVCASPARAWGSGTGSDWEPLGAPGPPADALGEQLQPPQRCRPRSSCHTQNQPCCLFLIQLLSSTGCLPRPSPCPLAPGAGAGRGSQPPTANYSHSQLAAILLRSCSVRIYYI